MPNVTVRLSDEDHAELTFRAEQLGVSLSLYIRCMAITGEPPKSAAARPVAVSVFHNLPFVRRLADAALQQLTQDRDPQTAKNARLELERRDQISRGIYKEHAVDPDAPGKPPRRWEPRRRNPHNLPSRLQVNNPAAKELARGLAPLDDEALALRAASHDPVLADAAQKEQERRARGVRLFGRRA